MGWKPATLRAKLSPQIYPTALWQVQSVKHLRAWQQPLHQTFDLPGIPCSSINYGSSDLHVLHVCDGGSPTERRLGKKWIFLSKHLDCSYVSVYTKQVWNYLSGHQLRLEPWRRMAFAFHPPQTAIQPKQNVRSKQQPHTSVPSGCLTHSSTLLLSKCSHHGVAACTKGWEQSWSCQTLANPTGSHGLAFQPVAHNPWVSVSDRSLTDPMNQKCWIFWLYTFDNLTSLLNWGNHNEALILLEFKN